MKKTLTVIIVVALLLLLPLTQAQVDSDTSQNADAATDAQTDPAASSETEEPDLTEKCRGAIFVKTGDIVSLCNIELTISSLDEGSVTINEQQITNGETQDLDGVEVTYRRYNTDTNEAKIRFEKKTEKPLSEFEKDSLKIFYGEDSIFAGTADAQTENLARIEYSETPAEDGVAPMNTAVLAIRSLSPGEIVLGLDFEGLNPENGENLLAEQLHLAYKINRFDITSLDKKRSTVTSLYDTPKLFSYRFLENPNNMLVQLGDTEYYLEIVEFDGLHAIKFSSDKEFTVLEGDEQQTTNTLLITTKLARIEPSEKSCKYDALGGKLDDFGRKLSVQGLYPALPEFFGVFEDYCKDSTTLVNYGCVGLKANFQDTSRVSFLEITCPKCENGACKTGPYCSDSDKYSADQSHTKGRVTIYGLPPNFEALGAPEDLFDYGMDLSRKKDFRDECKDGKLVEYKCDLTKTGGWSSTEIECAAGEVCTDGACVLEAPVVPPPIACTEDSGCPTGKVCTAGVCGEPAAIQPPIACTEDSGCPTGKVCTDEVCSDPTAAQQQAAEADAEELASLRLELTNLEFLISRLITITAP